VFFDSRIFEEEDEVEEEQAISNEPVNNRVVFIRSKVCTSRSKSAVPFKPRSLSLSKCSKKKKKWRERTRREREIMIESVCESECVCNRERAREASNISRWMDGY
jgi:hypothetical protein